MIVKIFSFQRSYSLRASTLQSCSVKTINSLYMACIWWSMLERLPDKSVC